MMTTTPVAFQIERLAASRFRAVLLDCHGNVTFKYTTDACADQAASTATRSGTRPLRYAGMVRWFNGEVVPMDTDMSCEVSPRDWTWQHHGHTHGTLDRLSRRGVA